MKDRQSHCFSTSVRCAWSRPLCKGGGIKENKKTRILVTLPTSKQYPREMHSVHKNNVRKGIPNPLGQITLPEGQFKHLIIDYVDMIHPVTKLRYIWVVIDRFSRWKEAIPTGA